MVWEWWKVLNRLQKAGEGRNVCVQINAPMCKCWRLGMQKAKKKKRLMVIRAVFSSQPPWTSAQCTPCWGYPEACPVPHAWGVNFVGKALLHCTSAPPTSSQRHWGDVGCWCHLPAPHRVLHQPSGICKLPITSQEMLVHT